MYSSTVIAYSFLFCDFVSWLKFREWSISFFRSLLWTGNRTLIPADHAPAVAMVDWHMAHLLGCMLGA